MRREAYSEGYGDEVLEVGPFFCGSSGHDMVAAILLREVSIDKGRISGNYRWRMLWLLLYVVLRVGNRETSGGVEV